MSRAPTTINSANYRFSLYNFDLWPLKIQITIEERNYLEQS